MIRPVPFSQDMESPARHWCCRCHSVKRTAQNGFHLPGPPGIWAEHNCQLFLGDSTVRAIGSGGARHHVIQGESQAQCSQVPFHSLFLPPYRKPSKTQSVISTISDGTQASETVSPMESVSQESYPVGKSDSGILPYWGK